MKSLYVLQMTFVLIVVMALWQVPAAAKVLELNAATFHSTLVTHKRPMLVEFYSPDCYFCLQLEPELEILSKRLKGRLSVAKLDARSGYDHNGIQVSSTPTIMLFKNGKAVDTVTKDLTGLRSAEYLQAFVEMHLGPDVSSLTSMDALESAVEENGVAVVGLFADEDSPGIRELTNIAKELRSHVRFFSTNSSEASEPFMGRYSATTLPSIFVLKRHNHTVFYHGFVGNEKKLHMFIDENAYPLVGNWSVLTYFRYVNRELPLVCLFYDEAAGEEWETQQAVQALEEAAMFTDKLAKFVTVEKHAAEEDGRMILRKMGLSFFRTPALAIRSADREQVYAYNQMWDITAENARKFVENFLADAEGVNHRCEARVAKRGSEEHSIKARERYVEFAEAEKERLQLGDDERMRDVDDEALRRLRKSTRKDLLVLYTARWCAFGVMLEELMQDMLASDALAEIREDLMLVRYDVARHEPREDVQMFERVPTLKYISARYKSIPHWYPGDVLDSEGIINFIQAYYSLRLVEIPGEGPSPFKTKKEKDRVDKALKFITQEMI